MATPKIVKGQYITILQGNGASPTELFTPICGITTRKIVDQVQHTDQYIRDCALPESVPFRRVGITGESWDLSGTGLIDRNNLAALQASMGKTGNWRFVLGQPVGDPIYGGYYAGPFNLTQLGITGTDADFAQIDITLLSDGAVTFTVVAGT